MPFAFRHESMAIANDAFDDTFLNLIRGIDSQDRLTFLTGLELFHYSKVSHRHASDFL